MYAPLSRPAVPRGGMTDRGPVAGATRETPRNGTAARSAAPDRSNGAMRRNAPVIAGEMEDGQNTAADLDRAARVTFDEMRAVLKNQPPWSREVESFRQKTRNYHQNLIFNHPLHPLSQSLDQLWVRTSYTLIASFREYVARAESAIQAQSDGAGSSRRRPRNEPADQELRKVLTRFRQALASEEAFYRQFILRLVRFFGMEEICKDMLSGVGLSVSGTGEEDDEGRKWSNEEKKEKVGLVYKALICLGDVERYKEQYSDGYRREKAGGSVSKGKGEEGERFSRARAYYDVARSLVPDDGSAYNQLAVIATYLNDDFATVYNYFRALAIKVPFKGINEILDKYLKKAFERWSEVENKPTKGDETEMDEWKRELVVLVAILYRQNGFSNLPTLKASILPTLSTFLLSRRLRSESIVRLTTITIGLHWHTRSLSSLLPLPAPGNTAPKSAARIQQSEDSALDLLLCVSIVLLTVSAAEIEEIMHSGDWTNPTDSAIADDTDTDRELHNSISAVLRRILPSLRLVSKWLKLHLDYLTRYPAPPTSPLETSIPTFWSAYYRLIEALARCFPLGMLPGLESGLEEDQDMRGFMPISRGLIKSNKAGEGEGDVHPNEEQLMRIADLQVDATLILQAQTSGTNAVPESTLLTANKETGDDQTREEDQQSVSTETEYDPVNMAMRVSLGGGDREFYDDVPVQAEKWRSPTKWDVNFQSTPVTNHFPPPSHPQTSSATLPFSPPAQSTAFDLLNNLVSPPPPHARPSQNTSSGPASPGLLFGFGGDGIWSMTREESTSQKGLKRDSFSQLDQMGPMSRGGSDRARQRGEIGAGGVKALWDTPISATGAGSPLGAFGGTAATPPRIGQIGDRRVSNGTTQPQHGPPGFAQAPMDAAQLFAGISGLGLGGPSPAHPGPGGSTIWSQPNTVATGVDHGVIGRPSQSQAHQQQVPAYGQMYGSGSTGGFNGYPSWG